MTAFNICYKLYEFCFENNGPSVQLILVKLLILGHLLQRNIIYYNHLKLLKFDKKYGKNYVQMYVLQELLLLMLGPAISTMVCVAFFFFFFSQSAFFLALRSQ